MAKSGSITIRASDQLTLPQAMGHLDNAKWSAAWASETKPGRDIEDFTVGDVKRTEARVMAILQIERHSAEITPVEQLGRK